MKRILLTFVLALAAGIACGPKATPDTSKDHQPPEPTPTGAATPSWPKDYSDLQPIEGTPFRFDHSPAEITAACDLAMKNSDEQLAKLVAIPDAKRSFEDSFEAFENVTVEVSESVSRLSFLKDVHTDAKVREASAACEEKAGKYFVTLGARKDLYLAMKGYLENAGRKEARDAQQRRLVEITMRDFRRNGLDLTDEKREELVKIRQRLTELGTRFSLNLSEDKSTVTVSKADLAGLDAEWLASRPKDKAGNIVLTTTPPDYLRVMENASKEATRKKMETAWMNRGGEGNRKLLDEAVELRAKAAKLLGFATHLDYVTEDRMAQNGKTVTAFLDRMLTGLKPGLEAETAKMQALKSTDTKDAKAKVHAWDWRYYMNQVKKRDYSIDEEQVRQFFPQDKVVAGMFGVYETLFAVRIKELTGQKLWADGVKLYEIRDQGTDRQVARFYVDYYTRENKYQHFAEFTLSPGRATTAGYRIPWAALVLNFSPPEGGKPALLSTKDVETLFHEFGHVVHDALTTARYASQAGTSTARDFVEAPSQMLEHWVYQPEVLAMISQDPKDPSKGMPIELAKKVSAARKYNAGVHYSRQLFLGTFDATIHSFQPRSASGLPSASPAGAPAPTEKADSDKVARDLWLKIMGYPEDAGAHFAGTFGHMFGYDGGYYGYLWSEVYAADMFTRFQKNGLLDPKTGRAYRDVILAKGRTVEARDLLREFLGREPNEEAFLSLVGIKKSS